MACLGRTGILGMSAYCRNKIFIRMKMEVDGYYLPTLVEVGCDHVWSGSLKEFLEVQGIH